MSAPLEVWLRGPVPGVAPLLQPVAHILLQAGEEVRAAISGLPAEAAWRAVGASAPIGFHVVHLANATDRIFTYARGESLTEAQIAGVAEERAAATTRPDLAAALDRLDAVIAAAVAQLRATSDADLLAPRELGRARIATNALGLLVHGAEHAARHAGQVTTLARIVGAGA